MADVYSTNQAAELIGISPATIHTWKKRNPERLLEGSHWLKDDKNSLLWTEQGIQALSALKDGNETEPLLGMNEPDIQEPSALENRYLPLLDMMADAIAPKLQRQLDQKVLGRVQSFATDAQPLTAVECVELLTQLGLKPANPAELLTGSTIQALPESK